MSFKYKIGQFFTFSVQLIKIFFRKIIKVPKYLGSWEKRIILILIAGIIFGIYLGIRQHILNTTKETPRKGGVYIEGTVGEVGYINPLFAKTDLDRDLIKLVFSGLTKFDNDKKIIPDLAEFWEIDPDYLTYTFRLRNNAYWHDGEKVTSDDVLFTISLLQEEEYQGPYQEVWQNVNLEKVDESTLRFSLVEPYAPFMYLTTIGVLPSHILSGISSLDLIDSEFNLNPIGSGPYQISDVSTDKRDKSVDLKYFNQYYSKKPYIEKITFKFYKDWDRAIKAYQSREVIALSKISCDKVKELATESSLTIYSSPLPEYSAIFFNLSSQELADINIRRALSISINKSEIIDNILYEQALSVGGPILFEEMNSDINNQYNPEMAEKILDQVGFKLENNERVKDGKKLEFNLAVSDNIIDTFVAEKVANYWKKIGVNLKINKYNLDSLDKMVFEKREFDLLIFGTNFGADLDPYILWASNQVTPVGYNFSGFTNPKVDELLKNAQKNFNAKSRKAMYEEADKYIQEQVPIIPLYQPIYNYGISSVVKGVTNTKLIDKSDRFLYISDWYIKTERVKK